MGSRIGDRAVVLGASFAGLLAARLLADAYGEVALVDRDALDDASGPRRAVPQGHHIHGLLGRGQQALEELLPGFTSELGSSGVPMGDMGTSLSWFFNGRMICQAETGLLCVSPGRPYLEQWVRRRVAALPNVTIIEQADIVGLAACDGQRISGARIRRRAGQDAEVLEADLVVDATGRGSRTPRWLRELGYPQVADERVKIDLTYTTTDYRGPLRVDPIGAGIGLVCVATRDMPRGAILARMPDRYALSLYGFLGDRPPNDRDGFLAFARSLPVPDIFAAVEHAVPLSDPVSMHFPASVRHRYERLDRLPEGLLVLGDAACSFNPIYAQGLSVAAAGAVVLGKHLAGGRPPQPRGFFRDLSAMLDAPWDMAAGGDLGFAGVEGQRTLKVRLANAYMPLLQSAARRDPFLASAFLRVAGLVDPPQALMRPAVISRVLRAAATRK